MAKVSAGVRKSCPGGPAFSHMQIKALKKKRDLLPDQRPSRAVVWKGHGRVRRQAAANGFRSVHPRLVRPSTISCWCLTYRLAASGPASESRREAGNRAAVIVSGLRPAGEGSASNKRGGHLGRKAGDDVSEVMMDQLKVQKTTGPPA